MHQILWLNGEHLTPNRLLSQQSQNSGPRPPNDRSKRAHQSNMGELGHFRAADYVQQGVGIFHPQSIYAGNFAVIHLPQVHGWSICPRLPAIILL
jgi:hypothetical protein